MILMLVLIELVSSNCVFKVTHLVSTATMKLIISVCRGGTQGARATV